MTSTSKDPCDDHHLLSHRFQSADNEARLRRLYADIEAEYDQQHDIEPRETQGAPAEYLEWHGVELTPMLCRYDTRVWRSSC